MDGLRITVSPTRVPLGRGVSREDRDAVLIRDHESGVRWVVVAKRVDGRPALVYISEESPPGEVLSRVSRIDRDQLAIVALRHKERSANEETQGFVSRPRPTRLALHSTMPEDSDLLQVIRDAVASQRSVRQTLAEVYGVSVNTADKWYKYARGRPGADDLPAPRRGRPAGRKNLNPKEQL
jgi:hypothetical protein